MRDWLREFWRQVYTKSVEPFVWIYYLSLLTWGIYSTLWPHADTFVALGLGKFYGPWCWIQIPATLMVMAGLLLPWFDRTMIYSPERPDQWMQCGGHSCMFFVLLAYEVVEWPRRDFGFFAIAPYVLGCFFLMVMTGREAIVARRTQ